MTFICAQCAVSVVHRCIWWRKREVKLFSTVNAVIHRQLLRARQGSSWLKPGSRKLNPSNVEYFPQLGSNAQTEYSKRTSSTRPLSRGDLSKVRSPLLLSQRSPAYPVWWRLLHPDCRRRISRSVTEISQLPKQGYYLLNRIDLTCSEFVFWNFT